MRLEPRDLKVWGLFVCAVVLLARPIGVALLCDSELDVMRVWRWPWDGLVELLCVVFV